jgi:hypothetical protein
MEEIARNVLPDSMSFEWTGTAYQERQAGNQARVILALSLIVVFLFLAAQYESWSLPFAILLVVPLAFVGALSAQAIAGPRQRHLLPDRARDADRARVEELDPDRRVRQAPPRGGPVARRRGARGRGDPAAAGGDDRVRVHPRRGAARDRARRGRGRRGGRSARRCSAACSWRRCSRSCSCRRYS